MHVDLMLKRQLDPACLFGGCKNNISGLFLVFGTLKNVFPHRITNVRDIGTANDLSMETQLALDFDFSSNLQWHTKFALFFQLNCTYNH